MDAPTATRASAAATVASASGVAGGAALLSTSPLASIKLAELGLPPPSSSICSITSLMDALSLPVVWGWLSGAKSAGHSQAASPH